MKVLKQKLLKKEAVVKDGIEVETSERRLDTIECKKCREVCHMGTYKKIYEKCQHPNKQLLFRTVG